MSRNNLSHQYTVRSSQVLAAAADLLRAIGRQERCTSFDRIQPQLSALKSAVAACAQVLSQAASSELVSDAERAALLDGLARETRIPESPNPRRGEEVSDAT